jgi:two-component system LytT family sensor kinase
MATRLGWPPRTAVKASLALWTFAFTLVAAITSLRGGGTLALQLLIQSGFWALAMSFSMGLHAVFRRLQHSRPLLRWPLLSLACAAVGVLQTLADVYLLAWLAEAYYPEWMSWAAIDVGRLASAWILYTWTFGFNVALFSMLSSIEEARRHALRAAEAEAAVRNAQLALLRLQLNPHFLFNTLNTISGLMLEGDIKTADHMLTRLSEFLRASLDIDPSALTPLGDELSTVEAYLQIEAVRFEDRFQVSYDCPDGLRAAEVPSFILQPLVENAIKHAVGPAMRPVRLVIGGRAAGGELILTVTDDGGRTGRPAARGGGVGLQNTQARLAAAYGERGRLVTQKLSSGFRAELRLPLTLARDSSGAVAELAI